MPITTIICQFQSSIDICAGFQASEAGYALQSSRVVLCGKLHRRCVVGIAC